jgi:replicative DNA helicase
MNIEQALLNKVISTGQLEEAVSRGVRSDLFADEECRDMFDYITDHARRYKSPPSTSAVETDRPNWKVEHNQESLDYLIDKFTVLCKRRLSQEALIELAKLTEDPQEGPNLDLHFLEVSRRLATLVPSTQVARFSDMEQRVAEYEERAAEGKKIGIPFGYPTLDEWTGGVQSHELVTIAGFSGLGKSTMLMSLAFNAWSQGYTPLYISLEMEAGAILRKFDAMAASLDYAKIKQLQLPERQIEEWRKTADEIAGKAHDIPVIDSIRGCTPDHVFAETVRHKPDLVLIDYLSLLRSSRPQRNSSMWQSLTEITQDLKQNARTLGIPIIAAAQTNRAGGKEGADLDNIGYSLSVVQDSDIMIGLFADEEMKDRKEMEIRLNKNRDGRLGKFMAKWDHESMEFRQLTIKDKFGKPGIESAADAS